ncbi:DUF892 family protein [Pedobacter sp. ASV1-7]|uniref:DUF892 family protein n=1 Tax=Pedobacter sp. ASV1-7 TaxID=3145237 RepID=UPI0032E874FB
MKPVLTDLAELYLQQLKGFLSSEKKYGKVIEKLTAAVVTDELKRALALTSADLPQQKERIKQCLALLNRKATAAAAGKTDLPFLEHIKLNKVTAKPSVLNDIKILHISEQIFQTKVIAYQNLQLMASVLEQEHAVLLLEQSTNDNQNNYGHLVQISANIIYPEAKNNK